MGGRCLGRSGIAGGVGQVEGPFVSLVSVVGPLAGARYGRFVVDREWTEVGDLGMTLGAPCVGKGLTIVDDWAVGGWTLIVSSYVYVSACVPASVCNSACACNVGADWREGEGYGECLEEAAVAPSRVRERRR
jgi:hypothetical protein